MGPCERCEDHEQRMYGCGWRKEYAGKATVEGTRDSTWKDCKSCPVWVACQPLLVDVAEMYPHFKQGTIGNVLDLPAPDLECLQAYSDEMAAFEAELMDR